MAFFEEQEGIVIGTGYSGAYNQFVSDILVLSKNLVETLDLISEGKIGGPASGEYIKSGSLYETGWRAATFTPFKIPYGYTGVEWLRSIYWNETPVLNDLGQFNFQNVNVSYTEGNPNGAVLSAATSLQTVSRSLGERFRGGEENAKFYRIFNKDCRSVIINVRFPNLSRTWQGGDGGIVRTSVEYNIFYRPIFSDPTHIVDFNGPVHESVFGKVTNGYVRSTKIDFSADVFDDPNFIGWELKLIRITPDAVTSFIKNQTYIDSLTEIYGNLFTYPNSAIVKSSFDAEFFSKVPDRAFDMNLLRVKIPGNYDPILKTYATNGFATSNGGWDGTFKTGVYWTDNPAWCFYDLLTNKRYGLGKYINDFYVDKFNLYEIGQYCDVLVADGKGGLEPRFTCNLIFNTRDEAYKVINDMASIFRGLTYYANGSIYAVQDSAKEDKVLFNNTNVENGDFNYSSSSKKTRHTVAIVRWNDPQDFYKPAIEYIEDLDGIRKYGIREIEFSAFGCTSRGQARRLGRWALLSDNTETETITFNTALEGAYLRPGDIFKVFDVNKKTKRYGGRVSSITNIQNTGAQVVLDSVVDLDNSIGYTLSVLTPSYNYNSSQVSGLISSDSSGIRKNFIQEFNFTGNQAVSTDTQTTISLYGRTFDNVNYFISGYPVWMLELSENYRNYTGAKYFTDRTYDYYRTLNVKELDVNKYEVVGLQYNSQKYADIESGLIFDSYAQNQNKAPDTPRSLIFNSYRDLFNNTIVDYSFLVDNPTYVNSYRVYVKNGDFVAPEVPSNDFLVATLPKETLTSSYTITGNGSYYFRIYSSNDVDGLISNGYASNNITINNISNINNVIISSLQLDGYTGVYSGVPQLSTINLFKTNDYNPTFNWQVGFRNNSFTDTTNLRFRATIRSLPDSSGSIYTTRVPADNIVYQETGIELINNVANFQFTLAKNVALPNGPYRDYQVVVEAHDSDGNTSAGNVIGSIENNFNYNPWGYDTLIVNNPRQTGIELSNNMPTQQSGAGDFVTGSQNGFSSIQYMGPNGDIIIRFESGSFDSDLVGGYLYVGNIPFPKDDVLDGDPYWTSRIQKSRFTFNPVYSYVNGPSAAFNIRGAPYAYVGISFYDKIDEAILNKGIDISDELYMSNNAIASNDANIGGIGVGGVGRLLALRITGYVDPTTAQTSDYVLGYIGSGSRVISVNSTSLDNLPTTQTTILYWTQPTDNFYTGIALGTGSAGGDINDGTIGIAGGGFATGSLVIMANGTLKSIADLALGDQVASMEFSFYNYGLDNWNTASWRGFNVSGPITLTQRVSTVTGIFTGMVNSVYKLNNNLSGSYENPLFGAQENTANLRFRTFQELSGMWNIARMWPYRIGVGLTNPRTFFDNINNFINVSSFELVNQPTPVFHVQVEPYHTFFISGYNMSKVGIPAQCHSGYCVHDVVSEF